MRDPSARPRIVVPRPQRLRTLSNIPFGWLDARLHSRHWIDLLSPEALAVYTFLCLAADRQGVSYYRRDRIGVTLGLHEDALRRAFDRLYQLDLVAYQPFHQHASDGFHQVLSLPEGSPPAFEELLRGPDDDDE